MSENKKLKVSVLMSVFNGEKFLKESIKSILEQTYKNFEFIIIDDGSTDKSVEIIKSFRDERIRLHKNPRNIGLTSSLNLGLGLAQGEYIVRMDADDISLPERIATQVEFMDANPNVAACGSWLKVIDSDLPAWKTPILSEEIFSLLLFQNNIFHPTSILNTKLLKKYKLKYNEEYKTAQDYELWYKIGKKSELGNIPKVLVHRRVHQQAVGQRKKQSQIDTANKIRRFLLADLGVKYSEDEFLTHCAIGQNQFAENLTEFAKIDQWLLKLWLVNKKSKFFAPDAFQTILIDKWRKFFHKVKAEQTEKLKFTENSLFLKENEQYKNIINQLIMKKPVVSIVVCAYNTEKLIGNALESLNNQTADASLFEIIVVDNNSKDKTKQVAESYAKKNERIKVVTEKQQGLSFARNRGFHEARANYISYMDDDAQARPDYVARIIKIIAEHEPDVFGGPIYPFYTTDKPAWFKDEYEIRMHYDKTGWMPKGKHLSGSNFIIKRDLLENYGGFDTSIGMKGGKISYGEEVAIIEKAHQENKKLYYDVNLIVEHHVPEFKMNIGYFIIKAYQAGKTAGYIYGDSHDFHKMQSLPSEVDSKLMNFEQGLKNRDIKKYPYPENYFIENVTPELHPLGRLNQFIMRQDKYNISEVLDYYYPRHQRLSIKDYVKSLIKLTKMLIK